MSKKVSFLAANRFSSEFHAIGYCIQAIDKIVALRKSRGTVPTSEILSRHCSRIELAVPITLTMTDHPSWKGMTYRKWMSYKIVQGCATCKRNCFS